MRKKFWLTYAIATMLMLTILYVAIGDNASSIMTDKQLSAILGAGPTYPDQYCTQTGGCQNLPCVDGVRDYSQSGNPLHADCYPRDGYTCSLEDPPGTEWSCCVQFYVNNCTDKSGPPQYDWHLMCF